MSKQELSTLSQPAATILPQGLIDDLRKMIDRARESVASTVNSTLEGLAKFALEAKFDDF